MGTMRTATTAPTRKVLATVGGGGIGDAFSEVFVYFLELALMHPVPDHVALAFRILFAGLCAVLAGYAMPPAADEGPTISRSSDS